MCGRYAATANPDELVEEFDIEFIGDVSAVAAPRFNVAPTDPVATIFSAEHDGELQRELGVSHWGLIPPWKSEKPMKLINARVETVNEKPSFRSAIRKRRCILPALGYYEWRAERIDGKQIKQPYFLQSTQGSLAMAGIYEFHKLPTGWIRTTSILTTEATDEFGWVHDRMPMVVARDAIGAWLDPALQDGIEAVGLVDVPDLQPAHAVSRAVNSVGNDGPQLIEPAATQPGLVE